MTGTKPAPGRRKALWRLISPRTLLPVFLAVFGLGILTSELVGILSSALPLTAQDLEFARRYADRGRSMLLIGLVVAPVVEEVIFRGLLLRGMLAGTPAPAAVVLSAIIFAFMHIGFGPHHMVPALVAGLLFGWMYVTTETVLLPIIAHSFWNGQWWLPEILLGERIAGYGGLDGAAGFPHQPLLWLLLGCLAAGTGLWFLRQRLPLAWDTRRESHAPQVRAVGQPIP